MNLRLPILSDQAEAFRDALVKLGMDRDEATQAVARFDEDGSGWLSFERLVLSTRVRPGDLFRLLQEHKYLPRSRESAAEAIAAADASVLHHLTTGYERARARGDGDAARMALMVLRRECSDKLERMGDWAA